MYNIILLRCLTSTPTAAADDVCTCTPRLLFVGSDCRMFANKDQKLAESCTTFSSSIYIRTALVKIISPSITLNAISYSVAVASGKTHRVIKYIKIHCVEIKRLLICGHISKSTESVHLNIVLYKFMYVYMGLL